MTCDRAYVIGSGPNGLAAAIVLAQARLSVEVFEAEAQPGGAARTLPLTLPGFLHDFGSAVHPLAAGSPFFISLPLAEHGLHWIHGDAPLAHPLDDGTAVVLDRDLDNAEIALGPDGKTWRSIVEPLVSQWPQFADEILKPIFHIPRHPILMARFSVAAVQPAERIARSYFKSSRTQALFAGLAAHSSLSFEQPLSSAIGIVLGAAAHAVDWPIPLGGAQAITESLLDYFRSLSGIVHLSSRVSALPWKELSRKELTMLCDITPRQLLSMEDGRLTGAYRRKLERFKYGPGIFKIDYALSDPIPWRAPDCRRSITVHVGGTFEEIARSEHAVACDQHPAQPFVIVAQPTLFDTSRAPEGKHVAWAYCHLPNGSNVDMAACIEAQIERFAPGFRDCILGRHIASPALLESMDSNLVGGDINGGAFNLRQSLFRPSIRAYATSVPNLYLCSSSTPPGGGVHGMCGFYAAKLAIRQMRRS